MATKVLKFNEEHIGLGKEGIIRCVSHFQSPPNHLQESHERERTKVVSSYYNQNAIDVAAAKVSKIT